VNEVLTLKEIRETSYFHTADGKNGEICTNESYMINRLLKYAESHNDLKIIKMPEENYGVMIASAPKKWFKFSPPRKVEMTDEKKRELAERMRNARVSREMS